MKSKILNASKGCDIFALKILRWAELCFKLCKISLRVCPKLDHNRFWSLVVLRYVYVESRWYQLSVYHVPRWVWRIVNTGRTLSQFQRWMKYALLIIRFLLFHDETGKQFITWFCWQRLARKMSHVSCHTFAHIFRILTKRKESRKNFFLSMEKIIF